MNSSATAELADLEFADVRPDVRLDIYRGEEWLTSFANDVHQGLSADPRRLSPKYFYDARGSELFDRICELPEYYPTRTEESILVARGPDIIDRSGQPRSSSWGPVRRSRPSICCAHCSRRWARRSTFRSSSPKLRCAKRRCG